MKEKKQPKLRCKWLVIWLVQFASTLALGVLIAQSYYLGAVLHGILFWGLMSVAGCISACMATRKGLLNYAAWIAPPMMGLLGHYLVWGYAPNAGPIFLCAFISLVGAAAGEVLKRQETYKHK